jgi:hypothetical protein
MRGVEVRTLQKHGGREIVGAVLTSPVEASTQRAEELPTAVREGEYVVKITEYVEAAPLELEAERKEAGESADTPTPLPWRFYLVVETENGNMVVTEKLKDGREVRTENPQGLEARCALAKVAGCADCCGAGATLRDILRQ